MIALQQKRLRFNSLFHMKFTKQKMSKIKRETDVISHSYNSSSVKKKVATGATCNITLSYIKM